LGVTNGYAKVSIQFLLSFTQIRYL